MVYMAADNNLYAAAESNVREITRRSCTADVSIVVQLDGPGAMDSSRYSCEGEDRAIKKHQFKVEGPDREQRLEQFLIWCRQNCPADNYFLVLWGHGEGLDRLYIYKNREAHHRAEVFEVPVSGSASEPFKDSELREALRKLGFPVSGMLHSSNANHYLKNVQLRAVLNRFRRNDKGVDLLGFDACLMGMVEICHEIRNLVPFVIASADTIPDKSWPYDLILADLARNPGMEPRVLSAVIVNRYVQRYSDTVRKVSLSSFDLSLCDLLAEGMRALVNELRSVLSGGEKRKRVWEARQGACRFEEKSYIDLYLFCRGLQRLFSGDLVGGAAEGVANVLVLKPYVVYHDHSDSRRLKDSAGLSIYFPEKLDLPDSLDDDVGTEKTPPTSGKAVITEYQVIWSAYEMLQFCESTGWAQFLKDFLSQESR